MSRLAPSSETLTEYSRELPTGRMVIRVGIAQSEKAMREGFPWRVWAVTNLQAPNSDGLPMDAEAQLLHAAEAELLADVPGDGNTLYLGNIIHEGRYVCVLHSRENGIFGQHASTRIYGQRYVWDVYIENDAAGEFLQRKFLPTIDERRRIKDQEVLSALAGARDNSVVPRPITFYGLFPKRESAEAAAAKLHQQGFRISAPSEMPGKADLSWSLMFQRTAPTEAATIDRLSAVAEGLCRQHGGTYDGWSCEPVEG